jgi:hypothetical protein
MKIFLTYRNVGCIWMEDVPKLYCETCNKETEQCYYKLGRVDTDDIVCVCKVCDTINKVVPESERREFLNKHNLDGQYSGGGDLHLWQELGPSRNCDVCFFERGLEIVQNYVQGKPFFESKLAKTRDAGRVSERCYYNLQLGNIRQVYRGGLFSRFMPKTLIPIEAVKIYLCHEHKDWAEQTPEELSKKINSWLMLASSEIEASSEASIARKKQILSARKKQMLSELKASYEARKKRTPKSTQEKKK